MLQPRADLAGSEPPDAPALRRRSSGRLPHQADLRGADLAAVDLLADLRDARLEDADLSRALYLTQPQLNSARGSLGTRLPAGLEVPGHWRGDQHPGAREL
jgi:uncharacterized protein YjbI with pentapeptide repeats